MKMPANVVMGLQWGDEGKGKVIDILASQADVVVRSQGGNNAGHTVKVGDEVYKFHLMPSAILYKQTLCLVGCGTVMDPKSFVGELDGLQARGVPCDNLRIDPRVHIIMPWHIEIDGLMEDMKGGDDVGTTRKGIGPCYADKADRIGLRFYDLANPQLFREKAAKVGGYKNKLITQYYGGGAMDVDAIIEEYIGYGMRLAPYMDDVSVLAYEAVKAGKKVLFEGAQATLLDLDMGTYPYVTSSHPVAGGVCTGTGIGPTMIDSIIGVGKAYTTRVGKGPFPTELLDNVGDTIRERGAEYGTTTGRPRRTGWFDAVLVRHGVRVNGLTQLAINKLDTLSGLGDLKICVAYRYPDGSTTEHFPPTLEQLQECTPIYETVPGFQEDISKCRRFEELPQACKEYIIALEKLCGCPITMVGVGPARDQVLTRTK